jgi:predicted nucleotidyltransferase
MTTDKLEQVQRMLEGQPSVLAAYLHGSTAKGTARPDSDVDLALLPNPGEHLSLKFRLECAGELESILGCPVDIGELSTRNLVYAKEVIANGQEIFTANRFQSDLFMATSLAMYAELQQQRKEVLDAYSAT